MIKTTLKHWIYELCIKQLFDAIKLNFSLLNVKSFKVGDKFKEIHEINNGVATIYRNCKITQVYSDSIILGFTEKDVYTGKFEDISYTVGFDAGILEKYTTAIMTAVVNKHNIVNIIK
jgi:hypothetical protein